jgi:hypothetical protein
MITFVTFSPGSTGFVNRRAAENAEKKIKKIFLCVLCASAVIT